MPSGHAIYYTIFFGLLAWYGIKGYWDKWYGKLFSILSIGLIALVGPSRIYLGAHWTSDVIAGYIIGGTILYVTTIIIKKYEK
jgi:membrane-associated phospholipid phosphatase